MKQIIFLYLVFSPLLSMAQLGDYQLFMEAGRRQLQLKNYEMAGKKFAAALEFANTQSEQSDARSARQDAESGRVKAGENA